MPIDTTKLKEYFQKAKKFLLKDIWNIKLHREGKYFRILIIQLRIIIISIKGVLEDRIQLRASALCFYTIFSIIPIFAIMFGVAESLGAEVHLYNFINTIFNGQDMILEPLMNLTQRLLSQTKGQLMTGLGVGVLILAVNRLMHNLEMSFNDIWYIEEKRRFTNKLLIFFLMIFIAPVIIIISSIASIFLNNDINDFANSLPFLEPFMDIITNILSKSNDLIVWVFFILMFFVLPNTKVKPKAAIYSGIITGTMFNVLQWAYVTFQVGVTNTNVIYGSFAAIPLFLTWLQLSWLIVLIGAKLAFAIQNYHSKDKAFG